MCGISGILNLSAKRNHSEETVFRMISVLGHRGPDERGMYTDHCIQLGHSRLSIIGLESGTQPLSNSDGSLWIVYNGEVFNYIELREQLSNKGYRFVTDTDTEVILYLYQEMGPDCLSLLNGQFAMAIWDYKKRHLFLARDRVGICPLYYTFQNGSFLFASEIKALFMENGVHRQIDPVSLNQIFTVWAPIGSRTVFKDIHALCPGHYMIIRDGIADEQKPYWTLPYYPREQQWKGAWDEAAETLSALMEDAVRLRLRADVPVGAYLSGGLDSSIITSIICEKFNNRLKTFSIGFEDKAFDEADYQKEMIQKLNTEHRQVNVTNQMIQDHFSDVIWHCETPLLRTGPVPLFVLSGLVRDNRFKVVLTGEGADEIFGGYNIYKEAKIRAFWSRKPDSDLRPLLLMRLYPYIFKDADRQLSFLKRFFSVTPEDMQDPLMSHQTRWKNTQRATTFFNAHLQEELSAVNPLSEITGMLPEDFASRDLFDRAQWLETAIFMSSYLLTSQGDRMAMANGVELRVPYLDHRVIDFAARLPDHLKIYGMDEKYILKKAFWNRLPQSIRKRAKQPYRAPIRQALYGSGTSDLDRLVEVDKLSGAGIFNPEKVKRLIKKLSAVKQSTVSEVDSMAITGILSTQLIHELFIRGTGLMAAKPEPPEYIVRRQADGTLSGAVASL
ncbi:MAG: asparagine synthase (glutamine-hydrolyzing) [Desulfobacteraceae bacterium]|nr:MAG: asparagine synthase (glutamine-hydrolyzing) [Desulfobacteraceae bacterium]